MWHKTASSDTSMSRGLFFSESLQTAHPIKIACVYLTFNTDFFYVYHLGNSFLIYNFIKLSAKLHASLSSRAFQEEHHIEVTYCMSLISSPKKNVYLSKTLNYGVCVKGSHKKLLSSLFLHIKSYL